MKIKVFSSKNCGPCRRFVPELANLEKDNPNIIIERVSTDVSENWDTCRAAQVKVVPTVIFEDEAGNEVYRFRGFKTQADVENLLAVLDKD